MDFCLQGNFQVLDYEQLEYINGGGSNFWDGVKCAFVGVLLVAGTIAVACTAPLSIPVIIGVGIFYTAGNALIAAGTASAMGGAYNHN